MTTEGEQKEAVCTTCGGEGIVFHKPWHDPIHTCLDCDGTGRIPTPVVPSDDECNGCGHGQHGSPCGWLLSDDIEDECGCVKYAPPTPSQDAEGDGWRLVSRDSGGSLWTADDDPHYYEYVQAGIESSIRADYEELVKAARKVQAATVFAEHRWDSGGSMGYECTDESALAALDTALTRIEESLGGRKDG